MGRVKTFAPGGSGTPTDFNAIQDDYEAAFATYKIVADRAGSNGGSTIYFVGGTFTLGFGQRQPFGSGGATAAGGAWLDWDPAAYAASGRTVKLRVKAAVAANGIGLGGPVTFALVPVTMSGSTNDLVTTAGPSLCSVQITPGVNGVYRDVTADIIAPAVGPLALTVFINTTLPAGCVIQPLAQLQMRQV